MANVLVALCVCVKLSNDEITESAPASVLAKWTVPDGDSMAL